MKGGLWGFSVSRIGVAEMLRKSNRAGRMSQLMGVSKTAGPGMAPSRRTEDRTERVRRGAHGEAASRLLQDEAQSRYKAGFSRQTGPAVSPQGQAVPGPAVLLTPISWRSRIPSRRHRCAIQTVTQFIRWFLQTFRETLRLYLPSGRHRCSILCDGDRGRGRVRAACVLLRPSPE